MGLGPLLAYTADGSVTHTLDFMVQYADDVDRTPIGLVDFGAHEEAGGDHTEIWVADTGDPANPVKGSKVWPEWIERPGDFKVELDGLAGKKRIVALVHKESGHRRERAAIEAAIEARVAKSNGQPADIRDIVGGPNRPLLLHGTGRTKPRPKAVPSTLPVMKVNAPEPEPTSGSETPTP